MTLLPSNGTELERAIEAVIAAMLAIDVPIDRLWSPALCPAPVLPYLAWALSVDEWDVTWSEGRMREVVAAAIEIQRHKGTPWSVRRALEVLGYGTATVIERTEAARYDGTISYDGTHTYAPSDHWAEYRIVMDRPITLDQAKRVRAVLAMTAPARCHLKALDFRTAAITYDGSIRYDGTYSYGVA